MATSATEWTDGCFKIRFSTSSMLSRSPGRPVRPVRDRVVAQGITINGLTLKYADSPRGRLWTSEAFPPRDADTARAVFEAWQSLSAAPAPAYPMPSQTLATARAFSPANIDARPATWVAYVLLALFLLERILAHARRN